MEGAGEEHLTIDLGKTASIVGGVTRAPGSPTPDSATDQSWRVTAGKLRAGGSRRGGRSGKPPALLTGCRV
jgi:hypothetical protein